MFGAGCARAGVCGVRDAGGVCVEECFSLFCDA